jgi:hypothetical protein
MLYEPLQETLKATRLLAQKKVNVLKKLKAAQVKH